MTCRHLKPDAIDFARGVALAPSREAALERHLHTCAACASFVERQRAMSVALRRLDRERRASAVKTGQLDRLLTAFDRPRVRSRRTSVAVGLSLAASILIVVGLSVGIEHKAPVSSSTGVAATLAPPTSADGPEQRRGAFVVLPGATALPRFESGQVIQVDIPSAGGLVRAEVLIGQDGLVRAARLAQ